MRFIIMFSVLMLGLSGCSKPSPLHDAMEDMKEPFSTMRESDELSVMQAQYQAFSDALRTASTQKVAPEDQTTFDEGMRELTSANDALAQAINAGDVAQAKTLLQEMGDLRKQYHEQLGVKKN